MAPLHLSAAQRVAVAVAHPADVHPALPLAPLLAREAPLMPGWYWSIAITPPPVPVTATPAPQVAVSVDVAAEFLLSKLGKKEPGPWEIVLEPYENGHLPTSTTLEDAIRRRAAGMVPPVVVRGLSAQVRGYPLEGVRMLVWGSL